MQHPDIFFHKTVDVNNRAAPPGSLCIFVDPDQLLNLSKEEQKQLIAIVTKLEAMKPKIINGQAVPVEPAPLPKAIEHGQ